MSRPKPYSKSTKSKGKGKLITDFSSLESALTSSDNNDLESWLSEGVQQEEQGERYQFGPKAIRHYQNSIICYQCALTFDPHNFDAHYNAARSNFQLGTTHLPAPECFKAILASISGFKRSLRVLEKSGNTSLELVIDAKFNWAQALVVSQDMKEELTLLDTKEDAMEAKKLFIEVERLQTTEMEKIFSSTSNNGMGPEYMGEEDQGEDDMNVDGTGEAGAAAAVQGSIITPSQIIETIIESIENDLNLYPLVAVDQTLFEFQITIVKDITASFIRIDQLRLRIPSTQNTTALGLQLSLLSLSFASTCGAQLSNHSSTLQIIQAYETLNHTTPKHPDIISAFADFLVTQIPLSISRSPENSIYYAQKALALYEEVYSLLTDRFSPYRSITPQHSIPTLSTSNLLAQSKLHWIQYLAIREDDDNHRQFLSKRRSKESAKLRSNEALELSEIGWRVTAASPFNHYAAVKIAGVQSRTDWNTVKVARDVWFNLVRIVVYDSEIEDKEDPILGWEKICSNNRDGEADAKWYLKDIEGDFISEFAEGNEERLKRVLSEQ